MPVIRRPQDMVGSPTFGLNDSEEKPRSPMLDILVQEYLDEAERLEQEAAVPMARPEGAKQHAVSGIKSFIEGMGAPGGYFGQQKLREDAFAGQQADTLTRAKGLRDAARQQQQFDASLGETQRLRQIQEATERRLSEAGKRPDLVTVPPGHQPAIFDATAGTLTNVGTPTPKPGERDINLGSYTNAEGKYVEIFESATEKDPQTGRALRYEQPFGSTRAPGQSLTATGEVNLMKSLQTQWQKASKDIQDLYRANQIMQAGMNAARRGDMNAGAQSVLVTFQKFLDPQSVVRESEYARSAEGLNMANRIKGFYERHVATGGVGVPLPELETFATLATEINNRLAAEGTSLLSAEQQRIGRAADHYGIPRDLIFSGYNFNMGPNGQPIGMGQQPAPVAGPAAAPAQTPATPGATPTGRFRIAR